MAQNASGSFITAIKASLADSSKGWVVQAVRESKNVAAVSGGGGTISEFEPSGGGYQVVGGGTIAPVTSTERLRTDVTLIAGAIILGATPMQCRYSEIKIAGVFSEALIEINGSELRSTDSALNTTVMGMATAFQTARDAANITAFSATDDELLPDDIAEGLIASLADDDAQWRCTSSMTLPFYGGAGGVTRSCQLLALAKKIPAGGPPANVAYMEHSAQDGTLISAQVTCAGVTWRTRDADLRAAILEFADDYAEQRETDLTDALT